MRRRTFVHALTLAATGAVCAQARPATLVFGVCGDLTQADKLKDVGFDFIEPGVSKTLRPDVADVEYAPTLEKVKACVLPIRSCNGFIPGHFRLTGPAADSGPALDYAERACRRADLAGIPYIVLGSGAARRVPEGFDPTHAKEQFIDFCRQLAARIKDARVTVVLEPLNTQECNLLTRVAEGVEYVDAVQSPRIQLLADFYHMRRDHEGCDSLRKAGGRLRHCHIAESDRGAPGAKGEDLSDCFQALRDMGYTGGVACECKWPKENLEAAWRKALATLRAQSAC